MEKIVCGVFAFINTQFEHQFICNGLVWFYTVLSTYLFQEIQVNTDWTTRKVPWECHGISFLILFTLVKISF